jgi:hypothetical protein
MKTEDSEERDHPLAMVVNSPMLQGRRNKEDAFTGQAAYGMVFGS